MLSVYLVLAWAILFRLDAVSYGHSEVINPNCQLFGETLLQMPAQAQELKRHAISSSTITFAHNAMESNIVIGQVTKNHLTTVFKLFKISEYELPRQTGVQAGRAWAFQEVQVK